MLTNRFWCPTSRIATVSLALLAAAVITMEIPGAAEARDEPIRAASPNDESNAAVVSVATSNESNQKPADDVAKAETPTGQNAKNEQPIGGAGKPLAKELKLPQGKFRLGQWRSDAWPAKPDEFQAWQWTIKGQEITWSRPKQDAVRLSFAVDATKSPPQIDLTFLNGPDKGQTCQGIFLASRHAINLCFQDPGGKAR